MSPCGAIFAREGQAAAFVCSLPYAHKGPHESGVGADPASPDYYHITLKSVPFGIECIDVIEALGASYNVGCALKYLWRLDRKGTPADALNDLQKAKAYIEREIARRGAK